jgi:hypothetical protein
MKRSRSRAQSLRKGTDRSYDRDQPVGHRIPEHATGGIRKLRGRASAPAQVAKGFVNSLRAPPRYHVTNQMRIAREEIFGPVLSVVPIATTCKGSTPTTPLSFPATCSSLTLNLSPSSAPLASSSAKWLQKALRRTCYRSRGRTTS